MPEHVPNTVSEPILRNPPVKTPVKTPVKILQFLKEKPDLSLPELAALIGKSVSAVERASAKLVKAGKLRRIGPAKGGHWKVETKS
jgi:ATP-dependent DNA helicase RecG